MKLKLVALCLTVGLTAASIPAEAEPVVIMAAGSLRGVVADLAAEAKGALGIEVTPAFGGSGLLRERIEKGEKADLFLSADVGSPEKLAAAGHTVVPVVPFARNRMCIVSRKSARITATNLVKKLLAKDVRLKTSTPVADPSGDYAWSIFDNIEHTQPGAAAALKDKARALMDQGAAAALFKSNQADVTITYCSAVDALTKEVPDLTSFEIPARWDPHPLYGAAVLSDRPETFRLMLLLLSERGQAILARNHFVPLTVTQPQPSPSRD
ncbi:MAG: substrate-binding domain-containing protein [Proteobacteria bacterium]|nr:substrate-binding domain-containing protein [Pseudomonadota bacterium]